MKKQIVAILATIAVITTLLTVSALSNEVGYKLSPCDAIDVSIGNATVTDFLNATNMTTVQVYNFKGYKGENTWKVQWSSSDSLLDVYVNVATGNIAGIEEKTTPAPTPTPETKTWHSVITFSGSGDTATEPFTIKGDEWRIQYTVTHPSDGLGGHFSAFVFPRGQTKGAISYWSSPNDSYDRKHYVFKGCGDFYIDILSYRSQWELKVEDYY